MKLNNLDVLSTMRITQADGGENAQVLDIEFDVTKNATISNDLYNLAFYGMLNGFVTGADGGGVTTGIKFVAYDQNNAMVMQTTPVKLDKVTDEVYTRFQSICTYNKPDTTTDIYISKIEIIYVSNESSVEKLSTVLISTAPATNVFSEDIGTVPPIKKGILISGGQSTTFVGEFSLTFKS